MNVCKIIYYSFKKLDQGEILMKEDSIVQSVEEILNKDDVNIEYNIEGKKVKIPIEKIARMGYNGNEHKYVLKKIIV
jgi:hypothetical protein